MHHYLRRPISCLRIEMTIFNERAPASLKPRQLKRARAVIKRLVLDRHIPGEKRQTLCMSVVESAPTESGVYFFFRQGEDAIQYIGKADNLKERLKQHFADCRSIKLKELIASGKAEIDWYRIPYAGWCEHLEIVEHRLRSDQQLPPCNKKEGGDACRKDLFDLVVVLLLLCCVVGVVAGAIAGYATYGTVTAIIGAIVGAVLVPCLALVLLTAIQKWLGI